MMYRLLVFLAALPVWSWHGPGHRLVTRLSMERLPHEVPLAFRDGAAVAVDAANDPDFVKGTGLAHLAVTENLEHFFALESLGDAPVPLARYDLVSMLASLHRSPQEVGFLPYALAEWRERLTA